MFNDEAASQCGSVRTSEAFGAIDDDGVKQAGLRRVSRSVVAAAECRDEE